MNESMVFRMATADLLDRTFDALASVHRRRIVSELRVGDIETPALGEKFDMSKQALHRHVKVLEDAGLVERRRDGRTHSLVLVEDPLARVNDWVREVRSGWESSLDRLDDVMTQQAIHEDPATRRESTS